MGRRMSRKLSRTVLSGGKGGDNIKTLPITIDTDLKGTERAYAAGPDTGNLLCD